MHDTIEQDATAETMCHMSEPAKRHRRRHPGPIKIDGRIAIVPLTKGYSCLIDAEDVPLVQHKFWCAFTARGKCYAMAWNRNEDGKPAHVAMHRLIMEPPPGLHVDHVNGDSLDNRRSNLRLVTQQQNNANAPRRRDNQSGYKGVRKNNDKWRAQITVNKKVLYLGNFPTKELAYAAYCEAATKFHGKYARLS